MARLEGFRRAALALTVLSLVLPSGQAAAEPYVGVYLTGVPSSESDVDAEQTFLTTGALTRYQVKDAKIGSSVVYGGAVGYRFPSWSFLALEADAYHLSPGVKAQTRLATTAGSAPTPITSREGDLDITIVALSAVGSVSLLQDETRPEGRLQLYAGAGLGIFLTSVDATGGSPNAASVTIRDSDTSVGPHFKVGARWFLTRNLGAFLEFRYAHTTTEVEDTGFNNAGAPLKLRLKFDQDIPLFLGGISWHFR
jgi:opacity protein-like surface antigen